MKKAVVLSFALSWVLLFVPSVAARNTDNFSISSFTVDMTLSRDSEQRSVINVTETITAQFPNFDQNHGLERLFVDEYDGHPAKVTLKSITDQYGEPREYSFNDGRLRIGSGDSYVQGQQTYKISYTQRDVTRFFEDTGFDEFYWDVIGVDWRVPIEQASVNFAVDESLVELISTELQCYAGSAGDSSGCQTSRQAPGEHVLSVQNLTPREGVTLAVGFEAGTFAPYKPSLFERVLLWWGIIQVLLAPIIIVMMAYVVYRYFRISNRSSDKTTIVPEYLPPKTASVTLSASLFYASRSAMSAQLIDLAVRHYVKLYEVREKTLFRAAEYEIEVTKDPSDLRWEERELLSDSFGSLPKLGERLNLKKLKNNMAFYRRTQNNDKDLDTLIKGEYGLKEPAPELKAWLRRAAFVLVVLGVLFISPIALISAVVVFAMSFGAWQLTDKAVELRQYLEGLKMYISVAEQDRIKMLQSPEGAEKVAEVSAGDEVRKRIILYEKVLPYAIIMGHEKDWGKQLGAYYEQIQQSPDWYAGSRTVMNAAVFTSVLDGISSTTTSVSSSSSSSGGSTGGGSAGGGGGGGGGGGW